MRPQQNYRRVQIATADPTQIVVMLYEGAISNLNQTQRLLGTDDAKALERVARTQEIINYLRSVLDHQRGGEISANLERLYEYMRDKLNETLIQRTPAPVGEVIHLLGILLEAWRGVAQQSAEPEPADEPAAAPPQGSFSFMG